MSLPDIRKIRNFITVELRAAGIENCIQEAELILGRVLNVSLAFILGHPEKILTGAEIDAAYKVLRRRVRREPLQYIWGEAHFWGMTLGVGEGVLVPRPETELLAELALDYLPADSTSFFLDWGTGSGCIAAALLRERPMAKGVLAEKNPLSLRWAWRNLKRHGLLARALLWHSREPADIPVGRGSLSLIVSNPPYIPSDEIPGLMREVRDHEPLLALDGGADGLDCYRMLFAHAPLWLREGGVLAVEIGGRAQAEQLRALAPPTICLIKEIPDYAGIMRLMGFQRA